MQKFLNSRELRDGGSLCRRGGETVPLDGDGQLVAGYRYSFKGPVKQCRLCVHHRPRNARPNSRGEICYRGAFSCAASDFQSSSGYVVALSCDRWELSPSAPRKNRGKAWLYLEDVKMNHEGHEGQ